MSRAGARTTSAASVAMSGSGALAITAAAWPGVGRSRSIRAKGAQKYSVSVNPFYDARALSEMCHFSMHSNLFHQSSQRCRCNAPAFLVLLQQGGSRAQPTLGGPGVLLGAGRGQ